MEAEKVGSIRRIVLDRPSLSHARNVGACAASAEILLFLDDDVELPEGFISAHLAVYADETIAAVTGRLVSPGEDTRIDKPAPVSADEAARRLDLQVICHTTPLRNPWHVAGGNLSVRRCWYLSIGGFNERFGSPALADDVEFGGRLRRRGGTIVHAPECWLVHLAAPRGGTRADVPSPFQRSRRRMNDYYFAMFSGLGWRDGLRAAKRRWQRGRVSSGTASAASGYAATTAQRLQSLAGRFVGAMQGIAGSVLARPPVALQPNTGLAAHSGSISVVIATYRRAEALHRLLEVLLTMRGEFLDVVVIDQSPVPDSWVMELAAANDWIVYAHGLAPNASRARNHGVAMAGGDLVLFLDDDAIPEAGLWDAYRQAMADPAVAACGGRILFPGREGDDTPFPGSAAEAATHPDAPVCYCATPFPDVLHVISCNLLVRRDWFVMTGGFHERLTGYGEDLDLVARLRRAGGRVAYAPNARVVHHQELHGGIRQTARAPFSSGYRRGMAHHYSMMRAVGLSGWLAVTGRRVSARLARVLGRSRPAAAPGAPAQLTTRGGLNRLAWHLGALVAWPAAFVLYMRHGSSAGDYLHTAQVARRGATGRMQRR